MGAPEGLLRAADLSRLKRRILRGRRHAARNSAGARAQRVQHRMELSRPPDRDHLPFLRALLRRRRSGRQDGAEGNGEGSVGENGPKTGQGTGPHPARLESRPVPCRVFLLPQRWRGSSQRSWKVACYTHGGFFVPEAGTGLRTAGLEPVPCRFWFIPDAGRSPGRRGRLLSALPG